MQTIDIRQSRDGANCIVGVSIQEGHVHQTRRGCCCLTRQVFCSYLLSCLLIARLFKSLRPCASQFNAALTWSPRRVECRERAVNTHANVKRVRSEGFSQGVFTFLPYSKTAINDALLLPRPLRLS